MWRSAAKRENVAFHLTREDAEQSGFRPANAAGQTTAVAEQHAAAVAKACRLIEESDPVPDLAALAEAAGMSRFHFHRVFRLIRRV